MAKKNIRYFYIYLLVIIAIAFPSEEVLANTINIESFVISGNESVFSQKEISVNVDAESDVLYQFWINDLSINRWIMIRDYSEESSVGWTPQKIGNYMYGVHVKHKNSTQRLDTHQYNSITIRKPNLAYIESLEIYGHQIFGTEQEILAESVSETGTLYQFWIKDLSTNRWEMIQDYSEKSSVKWSPIKIGDYLYGVHIKDKNSRGVLDSHQYNTITIRKPNLAYIESLNIYGNQISGTEQEILAEGVSETGTLYQFWIKDLSTNRWEMIQDYSEKSSVKWSPIKTGEYLYGLHIKDKNSQKALDSHLYNFVTIRIPNLASLDSLNIVGNQIIGTEQEILAEGVSETGILYQFWIKNLDTNRWEMIKDYSENNRVKWSPIKTGEYLYGVHIKDRGSKMKLDYFRYQNISIRSPKPAVLNSLAIIGNDSSSSLKTIEAQGNAETKILYQFWIKDLSTNKWILIQDYSEKNTVDWIPLKKGRYLYGVHVKDEMSTQALDSHRYVEIDIFGEYVYRYSYYQSTLQNALDEQMKKNPIMYSTSQVQEPATREQVEFQLNPNNYVPFLESENNIYMSRAQINVNQLNVRSGPSTNYTVISTVSKNQIFDILDESSGWYKIRSSIGDGWISSTNCILLGQKRNVPVFDIGMFQFIVLSGTTGINESDLNAELIGRGILEGKASSFIIAGRKANINELYLVAHARLETGNGKSKLANGILITTIDGEQVDEPKVVYNMFGIGAIDGDALRAGSEFAYKQGWFTPEAAIIGGAEWIGRGYINSSYYAQNTLYKMRWNPALPSHWHQYATDIGWATKQNTLMESLVNAAQRYNVTIKFDIPVYKK